ncbi:MAG: hypothetical protein SOX72_04345 [Oscillospiraceae bacterium]|nr:hypothetical protein [Lawsonibacter sp.]MDY4191429.1 hypothetical protein [Oscillospiraceae bacterium]
MNMMFSTVGLALVAAIFMMLVPIALLVVLQVWLCRKGRRLGLILPVLSLLVSLLLVFSMAGFQTVTRAGAHMVDEKGQIVEGYEPEPVHSELTPGAAGAIAGLFLVSNIPTVVFGGIWLHYKNRRDFQDDLKKMKIEDLE